ncbi:MAG: response regulator transcription factor [Candidatus Izimaplasma sp.]|nr:response regulator transcription factor [Candidatus Izimaplasma bacterium]
MKTILVCEDHKEINHLVTTHLEEQGYTVYPTYNAIDALQVFREEQLDVIITDLRLPVMSGEEFIAEVRKTSAIHIIVISAKTDLTDKLNGLKIGANDYIYKPFVPEEISYKLRNLFSQKNTPKTQTFHQGELIFKQNDMTLTINNQDVTLTAVEYRLLKYLIMHPKQVISRDQLLDIIHDYQDEVFDRVIDVHIKNIRKKIKAHSDTPYIKTVYGLGYKFVGDKDA